MLIFSRACFFIFCVPWCPMNHPTFTNKFHLYIHSNHANTSNENWIMKIFVYFSINIRTRYIGYWYWHRPSRYTLNDYMVLGSHNSTLKWIIIALTGSSDDQIAVALLVMRHAEASQCFFVINNFFRICLKKVLWRCSTLNVNCYWFSPFSSFSFSLSLSPRYCISISTNTNSITSSS